MFCCSGTFIVCNWGAGYDRATVCVVTCGTFHHLRGDPRHGNGGLFDIFDHACNVNHAVAQLLFPSFDTQGLQPRIRLLVSTIAIKLELRVLLEVRDTLVYVVTAVHSTSGARARLCDVDRTHHAPLRLQRPVKLLGSSLVVSRSSHSLPGEPGTGCTVGIDRDPV